MQKQNRNKPPSHIPRKETTQRKQEPNQRFMHSQSFGIPIIDLVETLTHCNGVKMKGLGFPKLSGIAVCPRPTAFCTYFNITATLINPRNSNHLSSSFKLREISVFKNLKHVF